jgi:hypothetical protein
VEAVGVDHQPEQPSSTAASIKPSTVASSLRIGLRAITSRACTEVALDLTFQAAHCEDVAPRHISSDAGDEPLEAIRVGCRNMLPGRLGAPVLVATDSLAEQLQATLRTIEVGRNAPLHGSSQCQQVGPGGHPNCIRVHGRTP